MAAFPSQQPISQPPVKMDDPFSGSQQIGVAYPSLSDFLRITQLKKYESKLKKLKVVETEDLKNLPARVGFLHVEEQRVRRYLDHFHRGVLKQAEEKAQPITIANFFKIAQLPKAEKIVRKYGVVEFDDLQFIAYSDRAAMLDSNKVKVNRFARYCHKVTNSPDIGVIETESQQLSADLKTFIDDAKLKSYKSTLEKLGVVEADDLPHIDRSDMNKMKQVEWERFVRYRDKFGREIHSRRISLTPAVQPASPTDISQQTTPPFQQETQQQQQQHTQSPTATAPPIATGPVPAPRPAHRLPMLHENSVDQNVNVNQPIINVNLPQVMNPQMPMPQLPTMPYPPQMVAGGMQPMFGNNTPYPQQPLTHTNSLPRGGNQWQQGYPAALHSPTSPTHPGGTFPPQTQDNLYDIPPAYTPALPPKMGNF